MAAVTYNVYIDWDNDGTVASGAFEANETVTANVLAVRSPLSFSFGRDTARSLAAIKPGEVTIELDNRTGIYSPDNSGGALFGNLGPGKPVLVRAVHNAVTYNLFWGYIDSYDLDPSKGARSVTLGCQDALGKFGEQKVTTDLSQSIQTGAAITEILDAAGWSGSKRDLDPGATTIRWFWADDEDVLTVLQEIVESEGPTAMAYIDSDGDFIFRDRHHRFLDAASTTSQATFRGSGAETSTDVNFSEPASIDVGFKDLCNDVTFTVEERDREALQVVWSNEDKFRISASGSVTFTIHTDDPFLEAVVPVLNTDYTVDTGSVSSVTLSRTSGSQTLITVTAGGSTTVVDSLQLRACPVTNQREYTIKASDATSQTKYGVKSWTEDVPRWVNKNDAAAIAAIIVGQRKDRLPVFELTVNHANDNRKAQSMSRNLSDMVTIVETNSSTNSTFYIEQCSYDLPGSRGATTTYGCEKVRTQDDPATIFILDSATLNHRLDSGKLAT